MVQQHGKPEGQSDDEGTGGGMMLVRSCWLGSVDLRTSTLIVSCLVVSMLSAICSALCFLVAGTGILALLVHGFLVSRH